MTINETLVASALVGSVGDTNYEIKKSGRSVAAGTGFQSVGEQRPRRAQRIARG